MIDGEGRSRRGVLLVLAIGVAAVSCAAVLVRLADAPALVIAAYRMGIAGLAMGAGCLVLGRGHGRRPVHRARLLWMALSGGFLALHFGTWIGSLHHTSVASSVVLVTSSPLLVAAASWLVLNERVLRREVLGITAGLAGGAVVVAGDWGSRDAVAGDLLALAGAAAMAPGRLDADGAGATAFASRAVSSLAIRSCAAKSSSRTPSTVAVCTTAPVRTSTTRAVIRRSGPMFW